MNPLTIKKGSWLSLKEHAQAIRKAVFIDEQGVSPEDEWDPADAECLHFVAWLDDHAVGTARLLPNGHIGRMAVLAHARGQQVGRALLEACVAAAATQGHTDVALSSQTHALGFYEKLGFVAEGPVYLDAGIEHRTMTLPLS